MRLRATILSLQNLVTLSVFVCSWKMSIRTNPMKAVPVLLKRVKTARRKFHESGRDESLDGKLDKLTRELNKIEDVFMRVKKNQDELVDALHEVDGHLRKLDRKRLDQDMDQFCKKIRDCAHKLLPMEAFEEDHKSSDDPSSSQQLLLSQLMQDSDREAFEEDHNTEIVQSSDDPFSSQHKKELLLSQLVQDWDWDKIERLEHPVPYCLGTLSIFPEDAIINKRHTIYWWIGGGLLQSTPEKTAEEAGEDVIHELLKLNIIVPYGNGKCPLVNKFKLNPHARPMLDLKQQRCVTRVTRPGMHHPEYYLCLWSWLVLTQQKVTLGDGLKLDNFMRIVFNVGVRYLNFGSQWLDKSINLKVLQLGRWQDSPSHHIEVGSQEFLKDLRNQKELRYLSLRGISRISELPTSVVQLESLQILDLKACHNLQTLPDDISSLKSLTHLILSQCYLLDGMPKGIEKLTKLQVLKGFLIGSPMKTPGISDLANLKNLRRLSIRIGSGAVIEDGEFKSLEKLAALQHLKISWGVSKYSDIPIILPSSLKKLHLECFPGQRIPYWAPWFLSREGIKELHITGGKLESMIFDKDSSLRWSVVFVRLKYLKHLEVDLNTLKEFFPNLRYVEVKKVRNVSYFEWRKEERQG